jgi:hypothetical protein
VVVVTELHEELVLFEHAIFGRVLAVLPMIPDDAPYRVREGIARRRLTVVTGQCPCGARIDYTQTRGGVVRVEHERRCPADDDRLTKAIRRWAA